jgi:hypothetical protein
MFRSFNYSGGSLFAIAISFITIYLKTIETANENSVNSIKYE